MSELIITSTLNGVLYGMLLFLMASGLTLIFSMLGVLNFAHASFYMLGAFFGFQISRWFGFWPALLIAPLLAGLLGAAVERYGLRRVHRNGHVAELLFTFGLAFAIEEVVQIIWGAFTAGLDAGRIYNTWPLMNGAFMPENVMVNGSWWKDFADHRDGVQFIHRNLAWLVAAGLIGFAVHFRFQHLAGLPL